jgi:PKD repeat protein
MKKVFFFCYFMLCVLFYYCQNETAKWYFTGGGAIDFVTNPPSILANSSMTSSEACASIADGQGNLLFYSDGENIWNNSNVLMANGSQLFGDQSTSQGALIAKKPGSQSLYYLFTLDDFVGPKGLCYSIIDMSLAAGMGSVTVKNNFITANLSEKLTGIKHCNGTDFWILVLEAYSEKFLAYTLSSSGVSSSPVISTIGTNTLNNIFGHMKFSPNGKKLAVCLPGQNAIQLFDFDNSTGIVSNPILIAANVQGAYGIEFSPDGTKLYAVGANGSFGSQLFQFDICAGSPSAIIASQKLISSNSFVYYLFSVQVAKNGKIYLVHNGEKFLGAINNPNNIGVACNYIDSAQSISPKVAGNCLPNFITSSFRELTPFSYTSSCQHVSFSNVVPTNTVFNNCAAATYSMSGCSWNFGDAGSGSSNVSSLANPSHTFSAPGTYTVRLVRQFSCTSDTIRQVLTLSPGPSFSITGPSSFCPGESPVLASTNPAYKFLWSTGAKTSSITVTPAGTSAYYLTANDTVTGCSATHSLVLVLKSCVGVSEYNEIAPVKIFPNPGNGIYRFSVEHDSKITVYNQQGLIYFSGDIPAGNSELDLSRLADGILFVESINSKGRSFHKLVKQSDR